MKTMEKNLTLGELLEKKRQGQLEISHGTISIPVEPEIEPNSVLLIVDIQKKYSKHFSASYVAKVSRFLIEKADLFSETVLMFDIFKVNGFGDLIPSCIGKYANAAPIMKQYSSSLPNYQIQNSTFEGEEGLNYYELCDKRGNNIFYNESGAILQMTSSSGYGSYVQYCFQDFVETMKRWKKEGKKVYLIGGGIDNCVHLTNMILNTMEIENEVLRPYCYSISFANNYNPDCLDEVSEEERSFLETTPDGKLNWMFVKNQNEHLKKFLKAFYY